MMKKVVPFLLLLASGFATDSKGDLDKLMEGNARFAKDKPTELNRSIKSRKALKIGQKPFAVIVACSDSRVAPEILFDANLGELFVVRLAGNVVSNEALESINYALDHLGSSLIFVMGHQYCGAVDAVIQGVTKDIPEIAKQVKQSVAEARQKDPSDLLVTATKLNAIHTKEEIEKRLKPIAAIYAGYYNFQTGKVELLGTEGNHSAKSHNDNK